MALPLHAGELVSREKDVAAARMIDDLRASAKTQFESGNYLGALSIYDRALSLARSESYPDVRILHSNRAAAHARLEDYEAALSDANRCIALQSDWPKGYSRKAVALRGLHRPGHAEAALSAGIVACSGGDADDLRKQLRRFIAEDDGPDQGDVREAHPVHALLADVRFEIDDFVSSPAMRRSRSMTAVLRGQLPALQAAWQPDSAAFRLPGLRTTHLGMAGWAAGNVIIGDLDVAERCRVFCDIMAWLIERGVRVDGKDAEGNTPLIDACGDVRGHRDAARLLLDAGADINARSRSGCTPLLAAVMHANLDLIEYVLSRGARLDAKDNMGGDARCLAAHCPPVLALLDKHDPAKQGVVPGTDPTCLQCRKQPGGGVRAMWCGRCHVAAYCSKECQMQHWKAHKQDCKAWTGRRLRVKYTAQDSEGSYGTTISFSSINNAILNGSSPGELKRQMTDRQRKGALMTIKIQVPMVRTAAGPVAMRDGRPLLAYNRDRKFHVSIDSSQGDAAELIQTIIDKGPAGIKGYFRAFIENDDTLAVLPDQMLPAQPW